MFKYLVLNFIRKNQHTLNHLDSCCSSGRIGGESKCPGPVKHQDFTLTVEVGAHFWILVPGKAWVSLLEVENARQMVEELRMLPAE